MDTVEITLPVSNKKVVLRNYTTRKDDARSEAVLYAGVNAEQVGKDQKISFPVANVMGSQQAYIPLLVQSIDGAGGDEKQNLELLDGLHSEDYAAIEKAVEQIVVAHSPKAKEAKKASKNSTN